MSDVKALPEMEWGSDAVAAVLREFDFPYAALVPGASYRGLHDSIVNYLGNENPKMLLCLHEEHAVAIAHGYARVTGKAMLAVVHSNVGLMHATMAIWNAWCARVPIVMLGATGPLDATKRRPWIDWIHTAIDQAAMIRDYIKWDDTPTSPEAAMASVIRAVKIANTPPYGPTYVVLDAGMQEMKLEKPLAVPDVSRFGVPRPAEPLPEDIDWMLAAIKKAKKPLLIVGRVARTVEAWNERVALAESLGLAVISDQKVGAAFPTGHAQFTRGGRGGALKKVLQEADLIIDLDSIDLGGMLREAYGKEKVTATVVACSLDRHLHRGATMEYQQLPPIDRDLAVGPDEFVTALFTKIGKPKPKTAASTNGVANASKNGKPTGETGDKISIEDYSREFTSAFHGIEVCFTRVANGVNPAELSFTHPLDYLGHDGGGGVGSGPGIAVGAALALRGTNRLPVAGLGDGDYLMGVTAIWTAVQSEIPLLVVVANNGSFYNDEVHQEKVARQRNRPIERKWIGQRIEGPRPDLAMLARGQGAVGIGPITKVEDIRGAIEQGIKDVRAGKVCVIDVHVAPEYAKGLAEGIIGQSYAPAMDSERG